MATPRYDEWWSEADEARLEQEWEAHPRRNIIQATKRIGSLVTIWKLSLRLIRCIPNEILSAKFDLGYAVRIDDGRGQGGTVEDPLWSEGFCKKFKVILVHYLWEGSPRAFATVLQFAVKCRTNDHKPWAVTNYTLDRFLDVLAEEARANPSLSAPGLRQLAENRTQGFAPSPWCRLLHEIEKELQPPQGTSAITQGNSIFLVTQEDVGAILKAIDRVGANGVSSAVGTAEVEATWQSNFLAPDDPPSWENIKTLLRQYYMGMWREEDRRQRMMAAGTL